MMTAAQTPPLLCRVLVLHRADMLQLLNRPSRSGRVTNRRRDGGRVTARGCSRQALIRPDAGTL
jgi:hypothetical protein